MSQYTGEYPSPRQAHPPVAENGNVFHPNFKTERNDEQTSISSSDDGYVDTHKTEQDLEEDISTALTSQTLNADGTPKRPMNAFMIFARRRRPQVSAENQSMRTGEISKILSKEWTTMKAADKQFYLDQAKLLKDTFNEKYPDYVYRRRPNNSRKRRRPDGPNMRPIDNPLPSEAGDSVADTTESSHTDGEDSHMDSTKHVSYSHDMTYGYGEHGKYGPTSQARTSGFYAHSESLRSNGAHEGRVGYHSRLPHDLPSTTRLPPPGSNYSYGSHHSHSRTPPAYGSESVDIHEPWRVERSAPSWTGADRTLAALGPLKTHNYSSTDNSWGNSGSASSTSATTAASNLPFPTLNTPFFPNANSLQSYQSSSSPAAPQSGSASQYDSSNGHVYSNMAGREYEDRPYAPSPSISPVGSFTPNSSREIYPQRPSSIGRGLDAVQSISNYSHSQTLPPPSTISGTNEYWPREKMEGF